MKIIDPNDAIIDLSITPRYYNITNNHTIEFTNESTRKFGEPSIALRTIQDGYILYSIAASEFDSFSPLEENISFKIKITDDVTDKVIWRGKAFTTSQVTQNYKINV